MLLFLILLPFLAFAGLMLVTSSAVSLFAAAAITLAIVAYDLIAGRSLKMMAGGSVAIFVGLGSYVAFVDPQLNAMTVRIAVDVGILVIALASLAFRFPFTLQYALEIVDPETARLPDFLYANYVITLVWTAAFVLMLIANMLVIYLPTLPFWVAVGIAFGARNCAVYFTRWYPQHRRAKAQQANAMTDVFAKLVSDFLSTIIFLIVYAVSGDVLIATGVAIAGAVAQLIYAQVTKKHLGYMTYASLALVIVLGTATLLTDDPRFVLAKPSIAHFAIGTIMLKRGWMLRYMPDIVKQNAPDVITIAGYCWAALMFVLGLGVIAAAMTGDIKLWAIYVSVVMIGAKVVAFAIQYTITRIIVTRRLRAQASA